MVVRNWCLYYIILISASACGCGGAGSSKDAGMPDVTRQASKTESILKEKKAVKEIPRVVPSGASSLADSTSSTMQPGVDKKCDNPLVTGAVLTEHLEVLSVPDTNVDESDDVAYGDDVSTVVPPISINETSLPSSEASISSEVLSSVKEKPLKSSFEEKFRQAKANAEKRANEVQWKPNRASVSSDEDLSSTRSSIDSVDPYSEYMGEPESFLKEKKAKNIPIDAAFSASSLADSTSSTMQPGVDKVSDNPLVTGAVLTERFEVQSVPDLEVDESENVVSVEASQPISEVSSVCEKLSKRGFDPEKFRQAKANAEKRANEVRLKPNRASVSSDEDLSSTRSSIDSADASSISNEEDDSEEDAVGLNDSFMQHLDDVLEEGNGCEKSRSDLHSSAAASYRSSISAEEFQYSGHSLSEVDVQVENYSSRRSSLDDVAVSPIFKEEEDIENVGMVDRAGIFIGDAYSQGIDRDLQGSVSTSQRSSISSDELLSKDNLVGDNNSANNPAVESPAVVPALTGPLFEDDEDPSSIGEDSGSRQELSAGRGDIANAVPGSDMDSSGRLLSDRPTGDYSGNKEEQQSEDNDESQHLPLDSVDDSGSDMKSASVLSSVKNNGTSSVTSTPQKRSVHFAQKLDGLMGADANSESLVQSAPCLTDSPINAGKSVRDLDELLGDLRAKIGNEDLGDEQEEEENVECDESRSEDSLDLGLGVGIGEIISLNELMLEKVEGEGEGLVQSAGSRTPSEADGNMPTAPCVTPIDMNGNSVGVAIHVYEDVISTKLNELVVKRDTLQRIQDAIIEITAQYCNEIRAGYERMKNNFLESGGDNLMEGPFDSVTSPARIDSKFECYESQLEHIQKQIKNCDQEVKDSLDRYVVEMKNCMTDLYRMKTVVDVRYIFSCYYMSTGCDANRCQKEFTKLANDLVSKDLEGKLNLVIDYLAKHIGELESMEPQNKKVYLFEVYNPLHIYFSKLVGKDILDYIDEDLIPFHIEKNNPGEIMVCIKNAEFLKMCAQREYSEEILELSTTYAPGMLCFNPETQRRVVNFVFEGTFARQSYSSEDKAVKFFDMLYHYLNDQIPGEPIDYIYKEMIPLFIRADRSDLLVEWILNAEFGKKILNDKYNKKVFLDDVPMIDDTSEDEVERIYSYSQVLIESIIGRESQGDELSDISSYHKYLLDYITSKLPNNYDFITYIEEKIIPYFLRKGSRGKILDWIKYEQYIKKWLKINDLSEANCETLKDRGRPYLEWTEDIRDRAEYTKEIIELFRLRFKLEENIQRIKSSYIQIHAYISSSIRKDLLDYISEDIIPYYISENSSRDVLVWVSYLLKVQKWLIQGDALDYGYDIPDKSYENWHENFEESVEYTKFILKAVVEKYTCDEYKNGFEDFFKKLHDYFSTAVGKDFSEYIRDDIIPYYLEKDSSKELIDWVQLMTCVHQLLDKQSDNPWLNEVCDNVVKYTNDIVSDKWCENKYEALDYIDVLMKGALSVSRADEKIDRAKEVHIDFYNYISKKVDSDLLEYIDDTLIPYCLNRDEIRYDKIKVWIQYAEYMKQLLGKEFNDRVFTWEWNHQTNQSLIRNVLTTHITKEKKYELAGDINVSPEKPIYID